MRPSKFIIPVASAALFLISSCNKNDDGPLGLGAGCGYTWSVRVADELTALSEAASNYAQDSTQANCEAYKKAGREDLLKKEQEEISIINNFLPKQMSDEETKNICKKIIENLQAKSIKDMGKVMGVLKKEYGDVLDFSKVSNIIKGLLK